MPSYLKQGAAGEVRLTTCIDYGLTSPAAPILDVAQHLLDRRGHPSSKEGQRPFSKVCPKCPNSRGAHNCSHNRTSTISLPDTFPLTSWAALASRVYPIGHASSWRWRPPSHLDGY